MLDVAFYARLIRVTLAGGPFPSLERAIPLLLGTVAQESQFTYTEQLGGGPALGFGQCEPATEADIWVNYLAYQPELATFIFARCGCTCPDTGALQHNMVYGILLMRTHYLRCDPEGMPAASDLAAQAQRWKQYYNTPLGHGTEAQYMERYQTLVAPYYPTRHARGGA